MNTSYSNDRATQILVALLKEHNINIIIVSPGVTNMPFVMSVQHDNFFKLYSCVDERSAAYMACGIAEETGKPVVITCTEATASRNYIPGLTEAYYRKLPILAITGSHGKQNVGHLYEQSIDRGCHQNDTVIYSVEVDSRIPNAEWFNTVNINRAILELTHRGGGPVHINLVSTTFNASTLSLPSTRIIRRYGYTDEFPDITDGKRVAIFIGAHKLFSKEESELLDQFCSKYDAVAFCKHTSGYYGKYRFDYSLLSAQKYKNFSLFHCDIVIHIGEVSTGPLKPKEVWRISEDGELRDPFKRLTKVFEMSEILFLKRYIQISKKEDSSNSYLQECNKEYARLYSLIPELPFSNLWIAKTLAPNLPLKSIIHFGILNSLRSWNFFHIDNSIRRNSNIGGFGIDGVMSTVIGASLSFPERLYFCVLGDLAFFYDLNSLANRHVGNNLRILLINNGRGQEFRNYGHPGYYLGNFADPYIAAAGHFGNQSPTLVKQYVTSLGFRYISAKNKEDFLKLMDVFVANEIGDESIVFEVFTEQEDESRSLELICNMDKDVNIVAKEQVKDYMKKARSLLKFNK